MNRRRCEDWRGGYTLLELVLTIAIITLLTLLVVPRLINASPRIAVESEGIRLRADLAYAQQLAIAQSRAHRVLFKSSQEAISIYRVETPKPPALVVERSLGHGIDLVGCTFQSELLEFNLLGEPSEGGTVTLCGSDGATVTVTVKPGTGLVTVESSGKPL